MNDKNLHINYLEGKSAEIFSSGIISWERSEEQVWMEIEKQTQKLTTKTKKLVFSQYLKYAAAIIIFIVVASTFPFLYHKTVKSFPGEHITAALPDGSIIELNAGSHIKYYPLKWYFERKVIFEGEAFFQVQKGKKFEVQSKSGTTEVLGTSFNIYARDETYRVTCLTGLVKVDSQEKTPVILYPDTQVEIVNGKLVVSKNINTNNIVSWKNNQFFFSGNPLYEVINEIERQYGVTIKIQSDLNKRRFAGNFSKKINVEEVLDFVCKTMRIKFVKQSENVYTVVENS